VVLGWHGHDAGNGAGDSWCESMNDAERRPLQFLVLEKAAIRSAPFQSVERAGAVDDDVGALDRSVAGDVRVLVRHPHIHPGGAR